MGNCLCQSSLLDHSRSPSITTSDVFEIESRLTSHNNPWKKVSSLFGLSDLISENEMKSILLVSFPSLSSSHSISSSIPSGNSRTTSRSASRSSSPPSSRPASPSRLSPSSSFSSLNESDCFIHLENIFSHPILSDSLSLFLPVILLPSSSSSSSSPASSAPSSPLSSPSSSPKHRPIASPSSSSSRSPLTPLIQFDFLFPSFHSTESMTGSNGNTNNDNTTNNDKKHVTFSSITKPIYFFFSLSSSSSILSSASPKLCSSYSLLIDDISYGMVLALNHMEQIIIQKQNNNEKKHKSIDEHDDNQTQKKQKNFKSDLKINNYYHSLITSLRLLADEGKGRHENTIETTTIGIEWEKNQTNEKNKNKIMNKAEAIMGAINGVVSVYPGRLHNCLILSVSYNTSIVSYETLLSRLHENSLLSIIFTSSPSQHFTALSFCQSHSITDSIHVQRTDTAPSLLINNNYFILQSSYSVIPMTHSQLCRVNALLHEGKDASAVLSPTQQFAHSYVISSSQLSTKLKLKHQVINDDLFLQRWDLLINKIKNEINHFS